MDKCRYEGKAVYAFGVYDKNNKINKEYEYLLRQASKAGKLYCEYCGGKVRFNMGKIITPYFSHQCEIQGHKCRRMYESEEHKKGKMILFQKLCEDYSDEFGEISYKFDDKFTGDVYFRFKDGKELALEYEDALWNMAKVDQHKEFYHKHNISYRRFINCKVENLNNIYTNSEIGYLYSLIDFNFQDIYALDTERREIILFSKMVGDTKAGEYNEVLFKRYSLDEVKISKEGKIICDFQEQINKIKTEQYELALEIQKEKKQEAEDKMEELKNEAEAEEKREKSEQQLSLFDFL